MHLPLILISIWNRSVVFSPDLLTFAAPDPAQEQFLLPLSEHKLSFPSFLGPEHPAFSEIQQEFFRIRSISFGKTGSVWTSLQPKILFRNCGLRLRF